MAAGLRAEGLLAELASRAGRLARGWVWRMDAGGVAGLVCLIQSGEAERRRFSIPWLVVAPSLRRRGVGWQLVLHAIRAARSAGAIEVHAETRQDWPDAVAFWERVADRFRIVGSVAALSDSLLQPPSRSEECHTARKQVDANERAQIDA
ncbi:MAG: GNAT family N-acetyltransferase [Pirellulales bacterium]